MKQTKSQRTQTSKIVR